MLCIVLASEGGLDHPALHLLEGLGLGKFGFHEGLLIELDLSAPQKFDCSDL